MDFALNHGTHCSVFHQQSDLAPPQLAVGSAGRLPIVCRRPRTSHRAHRDTAPAVLSTTDTGYMSRQIRSFERINSIRVTNGNFNSSNSCKRLGTSRLHELHESKFPFVTCIEFIRSKLSNLSAHVSGAAVFPRDTPVVVIRLTGRRPTGADWPSGRDRCVVLVRPAGAGAGAGRLSAPPGPPRRPDRPGRL